MEDREQPLKFVKLTGEELTREEATSEAYVLTAGFDADIVYVFDKEGGERALEEWASRNEMSDLLERARRTIESLPDDPSAEVDALGSLDVAGSRAVLAGVRLSRNPRFGVPQRTVARSTADVPGLTAWLEGARGCETLGSTAVMLYEGTNFGPNRFLPAVTLAGGRRLDLSPRTFRSVLFI